MKLVLGTRGSDLALAQASLVTTVLQQQHADVVIETAVIRTSGDEGAVPIIDLRAGRKGMFTREIENALLDRRIDAAVHSAKDLPSAMDDALTIAAVLPRANPSDVLVTRADKPFDAKAKIGTSSVRRQHQVRAAYPGAELVDLRGNVPTRLRKLAEADCDAIILAAAGLERLGLSSDSFTRDGFQFHARLLPPDDFTPAGGQGIIALQIRAADGRTRELLRAIDHNATHQCLLAEREFLRLLDADCNSPVGVHASIEGESMKMHAQIFEPQLRVAAATRSRREPFELAAELFRQIHG